MPEHVGRTLLSDALTLALLVILTGKGTASSRAE
jgi:hypothetical protein